MTTTTRRAALLFTAGVSLLAVTGFFGAQCAAGFAYLGGQRAYFAGDFAPAWNLYQRALALGYDRETLDADLVETLVFGLDQQSLGVKVALPLTEDEAVTTVRATLAQLLRIAPYKSYYWSLVSDLNLFDARRERRRTPLDLSALSDNPLENLLPREGIAVAALVEAARREPANYVYEDLLAEQYLEWGAIDPAVQHVRKAVALYPVLAGHTYLAAPPIDPRVVDAAVAGFEDALAAESMVSKEMMDCDAGSLLLAQGRYDDAAAHFRRALDKSPGMSEALYRYGVVAFLTERYKEADDMLTRAAPDFPDTASLYRFLGLARLKEGKQSEGIEALRTAREIAPHDVALFHDLANALESSGMVKDAERQYMAAAHLNPQHVEAWSALLDFYARHAELASGARRACTHLGTLKIDPGVYKAKCDAILREGS